MFGVGYAVDGAEGARARRMEERRGGKGYSWLVARWLERKEEKKRGGQGGEEGGKRERDILRVGRIEDPRVLAWHGLFLMIPVFSG